MNYSELQAAIIADTHKSEYAGETIQRLIAEGESLIRALVSTYALEYTLTDVDRASTESNVYSLPSRCQQVRYIYNANAMPLDQVDENLAWEFRTKTELTMYAIRPRAVLIAGTPSAESELALHYFGMPEALSEEDPTNTLLDDYPQLYKEAASIYVFKRAQDYESAQIMFQSVQGLATKINGNVKKLLGGARAVNIYNTNFRSSY